MSDTRAITQDGRIAVTTYYGGVENGRCFEIRDNQECNSLVINERQLCAMLALAEKNNCQLPFTFKED